MSAQREHTYDVPGRQQGKYMCRVCNAEEARFGNAVHGGVHCCADGGIGTWRWVDELLVTTVEQLKQLEDVWPVHWRVDSRPSVPAYYATVRGVEVTVQFIDPLPVGFLTKDRLGPFTGESLYELVCKLRQEVMNLTNKTMPIPVSVADRRVDIWNKLKQGLKTGRWQFSDHDFLASCSTPVGMHCVTLFTDDAGSVRVHMEISTATKLLYASSSVLPSPATLYDVRSALIDVTYQMMGITV